MASHQKKRSSSKGLLIRLLEVFVLPQRLLLWLFLKLIKNRYGLQIYLGFHGLIFLSMGYGVLLQNPVVGLLIAVFGVFIYCLIFFLLVPKKSLRSALSAVATLLIGFVWGDVIIDFIFSTGGEKTFIHHTFSILLLFYFYFFIEIILGTLSSKKPLL